MPCTPGHRKTPGGLPVLHIPDNEYHGCGTVWAAVHEDEVLELRYCDKYPLVHPGSPSVLAQANRKRTCPTTERLAARLNDESFRRWRTVSLDYLRTKYPQATIVLAIASCFELIIRHTIRPNNERR